MDVAWTLASGDLTKTGSAVTFHGELAGLDHKWVTWSPVMYTKNLVYLIDAGIMVSSGSPKTSDLYEEIVSVTALRNNVPDQIAEGNTWGYAGVDGSANYQSGHGLHGTGFYGKNKNGESFAYQLLLDAGEYQINTGHTEWWTQNRGTTVTVSYEDGAGTIVQKELGNAIWKDGVPWSEAAVQGTVSIPKDQTQITLTFTANTYNQGAVVSYIAVEKVPETPVIKEIQIEKLPNKLVYQLGEELDLTGMVVVASCSDAKRRVLSEEEYTVGELDSSEAGEQEITVTAVSTDGSVLTDRFRVMVSEAEYYTTKIKVTKQPDKETYLIDEEFDPTGMVVKAVKKASPSDAKSYEEEIEGYDVSYDLSSAGRSEVEIRYTVDNADGDVEDFTTSIMVTVKDTIQEEHYTTKIKVVKRPHKTVYECGEELDPEGMVVRAYQTASPSNAVSSEEIEDYELRIPSFQTSGRKTIRVIYEAEGKSGEIEQFMDTFQVQVKAPVSDERDSDNDSDSDSDRTMSGTWSDRQGTWLFRKSDGQLAKDEWGMIQGKWYHFDKTGIMQTDWVQDEGHWYFLKEDGSMAEETWVEVDSRWYYLHKNGILLENQWFFSKGHWYYLKADGSMAKNETTPDGLWVDESGVWMK